MNHKLLNSFQWDHNDYQTTIDQFVPKINNYSSSYPPWSNKRLKKLKSGKRAALKKYLRRRTAVSYYRYLTTNRQYKSLNKTLFMLHQRRIETDLKSRPKRFWSFINEQRKEVGLPSTMRLGENEVSSPPEICELFLRQLSSVFFKCDSR